MSIYFLLLPALLLALIPSWYVATSRFIPSETENKGYCSSIVYDADND